MTKEKLDLFKEFKKVWDFKVEEEDDIPEEKRQGYLDPSQIMMVVPKKESVKQHIEDLYAVEPATPPKIDYYNGDEKGEVSCWYAGDYLKMVLEMAKHSQYVRLSMKKDKPLRAETEEVVLFLAPRIEP